MFDFDTLETLFVLFAFLVQFVFVLFFALRKWAFMYAMRVGWMVYALGLPAALLSIALWQGGKSWSLVLAGLLHLVWGIFGYTVEQILHISWRTPIYWPVFAPYVLLYLATQMFYWFSVGMMSRPLWYLYALLFILSTFFNVTSHTRPEPDEAASTVS